MKEQRDLEILKSAEVIAHDDGDVCRGLQYIARDSEGDYYTAFIRDADREYESMPSSITLGEGPLEKCVMPPYRWVVYISPQEVDLVSRCMDKGFGIRPRHFRMGLNSRNENEYWLNIEEVRSEIEAELDYRKIMLDAIADVESDYFHEMLAGGDAPLGVDRDEFLERCVLRYC
jgi:hypothetical protein